MGFTALSPAIDRLQLLASTDAAVHLSAATGLVEQDYWAFIDPIAAKTERYWRDGDRRYGTGGGAETAFNAAMLTIHAVAALRGHSGPSRQDERARRLAARLCQSPPWSHRRTPVHPDKMFHVGGWLMRMGSPRGYMEKSVDPKVAEALATAWRARGVLGLGAGLGHLMAERVWRCASGPFYRYPSVRLNQINWNAELFAHAATMTGDTTLLRKDYREHMLRFVEGVRVPWEHDDLARPVYGGSPNLGPGYRFDYLITRPPGEAYNLDSAEYANIVVHFVLWYDRAVAAGMAPLPPGDRQLLKAWVERVLFGYWTHAGFLNWDTGLGRHRWQIGKTFALAQQGLLAIACSPSFHSRPEMGAWAKFVFDRGLDLHRRWAHEGPSPPLAPAYLNHTHPPAGVGHSSMLFFSVRMALNAARAIDLGLARRPTAEPPPFYAYDPDIGRLAVSTPAYSTAVLVANHGAVGYGGSELARFYDGNARPAANIGGLPPDTFGVIVRDSAGRAILASQRSHLQPCVRPSPLRLMHAPRGTGHTVAHPRHAYAAPFESIAAQAVVRAHGATVRTRHRFAADRIELEWTVGDAGRRARTVEVTFPSWPRDARVDAVLRSGRRVALATGALRRRVALADVAWLHVHGPKTGYVIVPAGGRGRPPGATAGALRTAPQPYDPLAGPTLALRLVNRARFRRCGFAVRIAPAPDAAQAPAVAARLLRR